MARILIIDDDVAFRDVQRDVLTHNGHDVDVADEGGEGLKKVKLSPPDLVITDIVMSGKEGLATIQALRDLYPGIPIIAVSGGGASTRPGNYLKIASRFGARATLEKPIDVENLLATVEEVLGEKSD